MFVYLLGVSAAIGGFLFGYDTGVISSAMPYIVNDLNLTLGQESLVVSILVGFCAIFSLVAGFLNSWFGRRRTIMGAALCFTLGAAVLAASVNVPMLFVGRGILGAAVGVASMTVPMYVAECAPAHVRGLMVVGFQLMITFGIFAASVLGWVFSMDWANPKETGWR